MPHTTNARAVPNRPCSRDAEFMKVRMLLADGRFDDSAGSLSEARQLPLGDLSDGGPDEKSLQRSAVRV